jgi:hypothetical protein
MPDLVGNGSFTQSSAVYLPSTVITYQCDKGFSIIGGSSSRTFIGPGSHPEYPTGTKNRHFVEDHPRNFPAKFGSNWPRGFGEEA